MPIVDGYIHPADHLEHGKPRIMDAIDNGANLVVRAEGGLALRYACPECPVLLEDPISIHGAGMFSAILEARGIPLSDERSPDFHAEFGLDN